MANAESRSEQKGMSTSGNGAQQSMKISREIPAIMAYIRITIFELQKASSQDL